MLVLTMGTLVDMLSFARTALEPFPEPAMIFDLEHESSVLVNNQFASALCRHGGKDPVPAGDLEDVPLKELADFGHIEWSDTILQSIIRGDARADGVHSAAWERWVITSAMRPLIDGTRYGLFTMHNHDEGQAWLAHTRLRGITELALYLGDAKHDNIVALQVVQDNYRRLSALEDSFGHLIEDFTNHRTLL